MQSAKDQAWKEYRPGKEYHQLMRMDEILVYLKSGQQKSTYTAKQIGVPTITFMIRGLQQYRAKKNKDILSGDNKITELNKVIQFYNTVLNRISKAQALQMDQRECPNLTQLMKFYTAYSGKVTTIYNKYVNPSNRDNKLKFWTKVQMCIDNYERLADNYEKIKNIRGSNDNNSQKQLQQYKGQVQTLTKRLNEYSPSRPTLNKQSMRQEKQSNDNTITAAKIQQIHAQFERLKRGELQQYNFQLKNNKQLQSVPYMQQLMKPIAEDYQRMKLIEDKLRAVCGESYQNKQNACFQALSQKMVLQVQYMQRSFLHKNTAKKQQTRQWPLTNKITTKYEPSAVNYPISTKQIQCMTKLQQCLIYGKNTYQQFKGAQARYNRDYNLPIGLFDTLESEFTKIRYVRQLLYETIYINNDYYNSIEGSTLVDQCKWLAQQVQEIISNKAKTLHMQLQSQSEIYIKNMQILFNIYNRWFDAKNRVLNEIIADAEQSKKQQEQKPVQDRDRDNEDIYSVQSERADLKRKNIKIKAKTDRIVHGPSKSMIEDMFQDLDINNISNDQLQQLYNSHVPKQLRNKIESDTRITVQTELLQEIYSLQTKMSYEEFKYRFRREAMNQSRFQLNLCEKVVAAVVECMGKVMQLPSGFDLFTYMAQLGYYKQVCTSNKKQQQGEAPNTNTNMNIKQQLKTSEQIIHDLTTANEQISNKNKQLIHSLQVLTQQIKQYQNNSSNKYSSQTPLLKQHNQLKTDNQYLSSRVNTLVEQYTKVNAENKRILGISQQWMDKYNAKINQCQVLNTKYHNIIDDYQANKVTVKTLNTQLTQDTAQLAKLKSQLAQTTAQLAKLKSRDSTNQHQLSVTKQNKQTNQKLMKNLQQQMNQKQATIATLTLPLQQKDKQIAQEKQSADKICTALSKLSQRYQLQTSKNKDFIKDYKTLFKIQQNQQLQLTDVKNQLQKVRQKQNQLSNDNNRNISFIKTLFHKLLTKHIKINQNIKDHYDQEQVDTEKKRREFIMAYLGLTDKQQSNEQQQKQEEQAVLPSIQQISDTSMMFSTKDNELFVIDSLTKYLKDNQIARFNLLYRSTTNTGTNINQILKKHANILIIIRTKLNHIIAGYSSLSYCQSMDMKQTQAVLISTHSQTSYPLKPQRKPIQTNQQFLIFGNANIKINKAVTDVLTMSVSFGDDSVFENYKHKEYDLIGDNAKEVQIQGFEIYQVVFKEDKVVQLQPKKIQNKQLQNLLKSSQPAMDRKPKSELVPNDSANVSDNNIQNAKSPNTKRNTSMNRGVEKQLRDLRDRVERYEKNIKILKEKLQKYQKDGVPVKQTPTLQPTPESPTRLVTERMNRQDSKRDEQELIGKYKIQINEKEQKIRKLTAEITSIKQQMQTNANKHKQQLQKQIKQQKQKQDRLTAQIQTLNKQMEQSKNQQSNQQQHQNSIQQPKPQQQGKPQSQSRPQAYEKIQQHKDTQNITNVDTVQAERAEQNINNCQPQDGRNDQVISNDAHQKLEKQLQYQIKQYQILKQAHDASQLKLKQYQNKQTQQIPIQTQTQQHKQECPKSQITAIQQQPNKNKWANKQSGGVEQSCHQQNDQPLDKQGMVKKRQGEGQQTYQADQEVKQENKNQSVQTQQLYDHRQPIISNSDHTVLPYSRQQEKQIKENQQLQDTHPEHPEEHNHQHKPSQMSNSDVTHLQYLLAQKTIEFDQLSQKYNKILQEGADRKIPPTQELQQTLKKLKNSICSRQAKLVQLDSQIADKNNKIADLQLQLSTLNEKLEEISKQKLQVQKFKAQMKKIENQSNKAKQQAIKAKEQVKKAKDDLKKIQDNNFDLIKKRNQIEKQYNRKFADTRAFEQKQKKIQQNIKQMEDKIEKLKKQQEELMKLKQNEDEFKQSILKLQADKQNLQNQIQDFERKLSQLDQQQLKVKTRIRQSQSMLVYVNQMNEQENVQKRKLQQAKKKTQQKMRELKQLQQKIKQFEQKQKRFKQKTNNTDQENTKKQQAKRLQIEELQKKAKEMEAHLEKAEKRLTQKKNEGLKYGGFPNRLFIGQMLEDEQDRQFIIQQIQKLHPGRTIVKSKFLFGLPLMKDINPHLKVDSIPNYIVIMKMKNRTKDNKHYIMALYSEEALEEKGKINRGKGFAASVTNRKAFYLTQSLTHNPRLTEYNQFYFVYGNSQIRFKVNSYELETNIGHNYKSFMTGNLKNPQIFTGSTDGMAQFQGYEIYQVIFDN